MRVLIKNNSLSARAGTELVVYEIGRELRRRGHEVAAYSSTLPLLHEAVIHSWQQRTRGTPEWELKRAVEDRRASLA